MKMKAILAILRWIEAWADLANAAVAVATFGLYWPQWDMRVRYLTAKRSLKLRRNMQVEKGWKATLTVKGIDEVSE